MIQALTHPYHPLPELIEKAYFQSVQVEMVLKPLMGLHLSPVKRVAMTAAGIGLTYFCRIIVKCIMCCIIFTAGHGTDETASFGIPDISPWR